MLRNLQWGCSENNESIQPKLWKSVNQNNIYISYVQNNNIYVYILFFLLKVYVYIYILFLLEFTQYE